MCNKPATGFLENRKVFEELEFLLLVHRKTTSKQHRNRVLQVSL